MVAICSGCSFHGLSEVGQFINNNKKKISKSFGEEEAQSVDTSEYVCPLLSPIED